MRPVDLDASARRAGFFQRIRTTMRNWLGNFLANSMLFDVDVSSAGLGSGCEYGNDEVSKSKPPLNATLGGVLS